MELDLEFYQSILDLFPGMISVVSEDFRVLYVNRALRSRYREDPVGRLCFEAFYAQEEPCPWCRKEEVLRERKSMVWEVFSPRDQRWYEVRSTALSWRNELGYLSVLIDITEKKRLEKRLRREVEFYTRILEETPVLILFNKDNRLSFVNRSFEKITGIPRERALGRSVFELMVPEEDRAEWEKHSQEVRQGVFKLGVELPVRTVSGEKRDLIWNCMRIEDPQGELIIIGMATDITEQKALFEQYLQAQKMESLGRFTGILLHELNNLFMALQGYLGVAQLRLNEPEKLREYFEKMENLIERWRNMSRELLTFSRQNTPQARILDLSEFLVRQVEVLQHLLGSKIRVKVEKIEEPLPVKINEVHLQQILFNLASNAREAMPQGGEVRVGLERVALSEETVALLGIPSGDHALLTFADTGPGIPPEILPHIFEPYFTTKEGGSGLGLATVYALVRQYGGHIAVSSVLGRGTVFKIYLPLVEAEEKRPIPAPGPEILVLEEEPHLLETLREMLEFLGYRPHLARGIFEARQRLEGGLRPAVLVSDIRTRSGEILSFIREIKERFPDLKLVIVSGYNEETVRQALSGLGEFYYLPKPFRLRDLERVLKQAAADE